MALYKGFNTRIQFIAESSYGVQVGAVNTALQGKVKSFSPDLNNNVVRTQGLGEGRNETFSGLGPFDIKWTMEVEVAFPEFFQFLIGTKGGVGNAATPFFVEEADILAFTGSPVLKSFKMEVGSDFASADDVDTYFGCIMNRVTFTAAIGAPLIASIEGFARTIVSNTTATAFTANTEAIFMYQQGNLNWNASNVARIQNATIIIDNKFDPEENKQLGTRFLVEPQPNERTYDWTAVFKMTDTIQTTLRDDFYGQANSAIDGVANPELIQRALILDFSQGSSSGNRNMQILLSNNSIDTWAKAVSIGGGLVEVNAAGHGQSGTLDTVNKPIKWWTV